MNYGYIKIQHTNAKNTYMQNQKNLFYEKNKFYGFKKISEERKGQIEEVAQFWTSQNQELNDKQKLYALYNLLNQYLKINIKPHLEPHDECFLFLITAFDPELKILQISMEETKKENIQKRFEEEFGFLYDARLLQIETYYNKRFPTIIDECNKKI